ncbi:ABC transporter ATP-binding protein [Bradyrhizobium sp. USDA 241]|uniref:ABC transporter ATP-binding protein n=1 Tax=Bradyrhizobium sp. USDA 241 TaxID=3377725 RepID=UPI003C749D08
MSAVALDYVPPEGSDSAPVLCVRSISKRYALYRSPGHLLAKALLGSMLREPPAYVALEDVNFDLMPGDALAVIGRNGAGKSTLLQILSGVLKPSSGSVDMLGRVAGLLELGSGFNPEFTGRENVFINGAILGLTERQIRARLQDIIAFADIGDYIDQPVKTYSSGMFLRLAFSVAIHAEPDLLLVDEALTVGDVFFQQKCYARLNELRKRGMTVLLVTHSMADAAEFCNRGIVLSQGRVVFEGLGKEAVEYYFHHEYGTPTGRGKIAAQSASPGTSDSRDATVQPNQDQDQDPFQVDRKATIDLTAVKQFGQPSIQALKAVITGRDNKPRRVFQQGDWLRIYVDFFVGERVEVPLVGVQLINAKGILVHGRNSLQFEAVPPSIAGEGMTLRCMQEFKLDVDVGEYTLETGLAELPKAVFQRRQSYPPSEIVPQIRLLSHVTGIAAISVIYRHHGNPCLFTHYGVADLPSHQHLTLLP